MREPIGPLLSVDQVLDKLKRACEIYYGEGVTEIVITGGEPTLNKCFLVELVDKLKINMDVKTVILSTNGYLLDRDYVNSLKRTGLNEIKLDIKAFSPSLHRWYTGKSNDNTLESVRLLHEEGIDLIVETVFIPRIVDVEEIKRIAEFLSGIDPKIKYKVNEFAPENAGTKISRRPTPEEIDTAVNIAKKSLVNVVKGKSCVREYEHKEIGKRRSWITVFPDLSMRRRSIEDYRGSILH